MKWEGNRESDNVEDRRSSGGGMPVFGGRSIGIGTIVIALLGGWALGINPLTILSLLSGGGAPTAQVQQAPAQRPPADDTMGRFVATVLADIAGDKPAAVDLDKLSLREYAERTVDTRHQTRDHRLARAGVAGEDHVERHIGGGEVVLLAELVDLDHVDELEFLAHHVLDGGLESGQLYREPQDRPFSF